MHEVILSVGIDIGTSTTQLIFSRLTIENRASSYTVPRIDIVDKEVIYRSEIYFTPLRSAAEIDADAILLAKNIDGVYSADPKKDPSAVKYDTITYDDMLAQHLPVMDSTATSLSMDNHIPVLVFALKDPYNIVRVLRGEKIGTIVKEA